MNERAPRTEVRTCRILGLFSLSLGLLGAIPAGCAFGRGGGESEAVGAAILIIWSLPCALVGTGFLIANRLRRRT